MKCIFCESNVNEQDITNTKSVITCPICGKYTTTHNDLFELERLFEQEDKYKNRKYLLSSYLAEKAEDGVHYTTITKETVETIFASEEIPKTIYERLNRMLARIYKKSSYLFEGIDWNVFDYNKQYAINEEEYINMIKALIELGYLKNATKTYSVFITLEGIEYLENLARKAEDSNKCFVAMWFDKNMLGVFENNIRKAVEETGYNAIIIPMVEHNDSICDHIIAEIKKAKFVIADFTGNRGGVYFEAGFALGLGKKVIWTCKEDYFNNTVKKVCVGKSADGNVVEIEVEEKREIHFDINHYNFIIWKDGEDLAKKLKDRIEATI